MRDFVLLYINGRREEVRGDRLFQSLSDFLRYDRQLVGTKVVCAEGDCGSCCVLIGQPQGDALSYRNVTSCIQYLYQLDGCHVITVEGLKENDKLSCVQEAMVACQGAQCGYCTPGFVVSMHAMLEGQPKLTERNMRLGLSGNLCRCTGYEAIMKAGESADLSQLKRANELYPPGPIVAALAPTMKEPVLIESGGKAFFKPTTVAEATAFKSKHAGCAIIAGGTDLGVVMNKGKFTPMVIMSVGSIAELRWMKIDGRINTLSFGALWTLADTGYSCQEFLPEMGRLLNRHGSPPIRNAGTLAGNIANGSPIGDTMPGLYVLNAEIELTGTDGSRRVNINEFYTGYRKSVMAVDEIITAVHIPLPWWGDHYRIFKISKRFDLDISTFSAAFWMRLHPKTKAIESIRIAYGGVGANILRLHKTEALLTGQPISDELIDAAAEQAAAEITPISDVRGAKEYRQALGGNIVRKFFTDPGEPSEHGPTPPGAHRSGDAIGATAGRRESTNGNKH